jgi:AmmeMemoRadiSam system protein A
MSFVTLTATEERTLLDSALGAIEQVLTTGAFVEPDVRGVGGVLAEPGATFVTLARDGALLGCIGTLSAYRPLMVDAAHHAVAAAFSDPRLPPISTADYRRMDLKVSVLSPPEPVAVRGLMHLASVVEPGRDGVLVESRHGHATFLPSVWEQLPDVDDFLDALWRKAGWQPRTWPTDLRASIYRTVEIGDAAPRSLPGAVA